MNKLQLPKLATISVESLRLRAYIGFSDWEREKLQDVIISFSFQYDIRLVTEHDDVSYAMDYKILTKKVIVLVENNTFQLLEYLAEKVYNTLQDFDNIIQDIEVKVEKPHALRFTDNVFVQISSKNRFKQVIIAMGSNINPEDNFIKALAELKSLGTILQRTDFRYTKALKFEDQDDFLNGAILVATHLPLQTLIMQLKQIEILMGRVKGENKNGPRPIDLDVLTYDKQLIDDDIYELPFLMDWIADLQPEVKIKH